MTLLEGIVEGKHVLNLRKGQKIFAQGDQADAIFFIQSGNVKISVVSSSGKEAVLVILGAHGFFGEGALVGQSLRMSTATTLEPSTVFRVEKPAMIRALHDQPAFSEKFMAALLVRNIRSEEHTSELQSHSFISYAVFCLKKKNM